MDIAIVIPAYKESENIEKLIIESFFGLFKVYKKKKEIINKIS